MWMCGCCMVRKQKSCTLERTVQSHTSGYTAAMFLSQQLTKAVWKEWSQYWGFFPVSWKSGGQKKTFGWTWMNKFWHFRNSKSQSASRCDRFYYQEEDGNNLRVVLLFKLLLGVQRETLWKAQSSLKSVLQRSGTNKQISISAAE